MAQYIHDIYVNWFKGEENPNLVPYFHSWHKQDNVTLLDQVPLIKVNTNLYKYLIYGLNELSEHFLKEIENKTYTRNNTERIKERYCCVVTDGKDSMAIMLNNMGFVHKKSRLIPRHFQLVHEMSEKMNLNFELTTEYDVSSFEHYAGLTRKERCLMKKIIYFINTLTTSHASLIKYLLSEINLELHKKLIHNGFEEVKKNLLNEIEIAELNKLINFNKILEKIKVK